MKRSDDRVFLFIRSSLFDILHSLHRRAMPNGPKLSGDEFRGELIFPMASVLDLSIVPSWVGTTGSFSDVGRSEGVKEPLVDQAGWPTAWSGGEVETFLDWRARRTRRVAWSRRACSSTSSARRAPGPGGS